MVLCIYGLFLSLDYSLQTVQPYYFFTHRVPAEQCLFFLVRPYSWLLVSICVVVVLRWVHKSQINSQEVCPYISKHIACCRWSGDQRKGCILQWAPALIRMLLMALPFFSSSSFNATSYPSCLFTIFFPPHIPRLPSPFLYVSLFALSFTQASKLIGN